MPTTRAALTYDNRDYLLKTTDERSKTVAFSYNDNNQLKTGADALGNSASNTYDGNDRLATATDRLGIRTRSVSRSVIPTSNIGIVEFLGRGGDRIGGCG